MIRALLCLLLMPLMAAAQMGSVSWGMSPRAVRRALTERGIAHHPIARAPDFLQAQRDDAVLIASREPASRTFYVFRAGKLRKLYTVFEPLAFPEGNFAAFSTQLERRFGPGVRTHDWIEWQDATTRIRSVDPTNGYGFYSLLFEDKR